MEASEATGVQLPAEQYERVFSVLERCDAARTVGDFKEIVLDSLASAFSYRHLTCFAGPTIKDVFADRSPALRGVLRGQLAGLPGPLAQVRRAVLRRGVPHAAP